MKELLPIEKNWLEKKNMNGLSIDSSWVRKTIFYYLYSDQEFKNNNSELQTYVAKTFGQGEFKKYFDVLGIDEESKLATFILFFNSIEEDYEWTNLKNRLLKLVQLVNALKGNSFNNYLLSYVSKNNYELQSLLDKIERDKYGIDVILFDESFKGRNLENKDLDRILETINLNPEIITSKRYTVKIKEDISGISKLEEPKKFFVLNYYDNNSKQTNKDEPRNSNFIQYGGKNGKNYIFSISAYSLYKAYETYGDQLFDKNVRYYIKGTGVNKTVNDGITSTLEHDSDKFWVLNNGLTIIGDNIKIDQNSKSISFDNFDIVNGAQTVTNIFYFGKKNKKMDLNSLKDVYVPAKIIGIEKIKNSLNQTELVNEIVRSANSQKPILDRDLVSNNPEMKQLQKVFQENGVVLNVKRGAENNDRQIAEDIKKELHINHPKMIKNDSVGQYVKSTILQEPAKAIQQKNKLFQPENYKKIFNNSDIQPIDIYQAYEFYSFFDEKLKMLIDQNELNFESYDYDVSIDEANLVTQIRENLFKQFFPWIIAFYWYIRWFNRSAKNKNEIVIPKPRDVINDLRDNPPGAYVVSSKLFYIPENTISETIKAIKNISDVMINKIYEMFSKANQDKKYGVASFSYNNVKGFNYGSFIIELLKKPQEVEDELKEIIYRFISA